MIMKDALRFNEVVRERDTKARRWRKAPGHKRSGLSAQFVGDHRIEQKARQSRLAPSHCFSQAIGWDIGCLDRWALSMSPFALQKFLIQ
jgi:hypothetical protein